MTEHEQLEFEFMKRELELLKEIVALKDEVAKLKWPNRMYVKRYDAGSIKPIDRDLLGGCSFS